MYDSIKTIISNNRNIMIALALFIFSTRIIFLLHFGPALFFDSDGYIKYAHLITSKTSWLYDVDLFTRPIFNLSAHPEVANDNIITVARLIGYPAVMALASTLTLEHGLYIVCILQSILSTLSFSLLFVYSLRIRIPLRIAATSILLCSLSTLFLYDVSILTDSLYTNILLICCLVLSLSWLDKNTSLWPFFIVTILLSFSMLLRDVGVLVVVFISAFSGIAQYFVGGRLKNSTLVFLILIGPTILLTQVYRTWNFYRSGDQFVTVASLNLLRPIVAMELSSSETIVKDKKLHQAISALNATTYDFGQCKPVNGSFDRIIIRKPLISLAHRCSFELQRLLIDKFGMNVVDMSSLARRSMLRIALTHPSSTIRYLVSEFWPQVPISILNFDHFVQWAAGGNWHRQISLRRYFDHKNFQRLGNETIIVIFIEILSRSLSAILFVIFFFGMPVLIMRKFYNCKRHAIALPMLFHYMISGIFIFGYSAVHIETRFFIISQVFIVLYGLYMVCTALSRIYLLNRCLKNC